MFIHRILSIFIKNQFTQAIETNYKIFLIYKRDKNKEYSTCIIKFQCSIIEEFMKKIEIACMMN